LLDQILARWPIVMLLLLVRHGHDCSLPVGTAYTDHLTRRRLAGALLVAQVAGQLGLQASLERCLDQGGYEPAVTGQLDLASVDLLEQGIQLSGGLQLLDQILARGPIVMLLLLVRHGHDCSVPLGTAYTDHLTRPRSALHLPAGPRPRPRRPPGGGVDAAHARAPARRGPARGVAP